MDRPRKRRPGFTLLELLFVILIIGVLIALLVPVVFAAIRTAQAAACTAEINDMATALADFKSKYGDYPPSRILLCEAGYSSALLSSTSQIAGPLQNVTQNQWPLTSPHVIVDITEGQLAARSLSALRKFFPRCTFAPVSVSPTPTVGNFYDFNGDGFFGVSSLNLGGGYTTYTVLTGSECLAFFLGGMPGYNGSGGYQNNGLIGFSKLPTNPFIDGVNSGPNRTTSLYEFNAGRLVDLDLDGFPAYLDTYSPSGTQIPYAYFASYGSNGYDPNDINDNGHATSIAGGSASYDTHIEVDDGGTTFVNRGFSVNFGGSLVASTAPNPYTTNAPLNVSTGTNYYNSNSFQLFSAGFDRLWGMGGLYYPNATARLPILTGDAGNINSESANLRTRENDNLTNFSSGRLN